MPWAFVFIRGAETYECILDRDLGQRLAGHNDEQMLGRRIAIELKPPQALVSFNRRRNIDWNMRGDPVVATFQSRIRKNHFGRAVAFGVKDVEIAVDVRLERNANPIAVMKFARRLDSHGATVHIAQVKRITEADRFSGCRY